MNERIRQLAEQATTYIDPSANDGVCWNFDKEKFAELIVKECAEICLEANDHKNILRHFGVEESRTQPDQEAAAFIAAEDKKVASRYGYFPKLHPSEWKD